MAAIDIKNITLFFASSLMIVFLSEVFLRLFFPQHVQIQSKNMYELDKNTGYKLTSNFNGMLSNRVEYTTTVQTNQYGIRSEILQKNKDRTQILMLGDSFVFGQGVEQSQTVSSLLERNINIKGPPVSVINAGVPGYGTAQEVSWLINYGVKLSPSIVVIGIFLGNDLKDNGLVNNQRSTLSRYENDSKKQWYRVITDYLYNNVHLYGLIHNLKNSLSNKKEINGIKHDTYLALQRYSSIESTQRKKELKNTNAAFAKLKKFAATNKIDLLIFLIPEAVQVEKWREEALNKILSHKAKIDINYPNKIFSEFALKYKIPLIDLTPTFRKESIENNPLYYPIDGHWNESGHTLAAKTLSKYFLANYLNRQGE